MKKYGIYTGFLSLLVVATLLIGCKAQPTQQYTVPELKYKLLATYSDYFWCDPDMYPIARDEQPGANTQFPMIQADIPEFQAILVHLNLPDKSDYSESEKLQIYREHKKLNGAVQFTVGDKVDNFVVRVGRNQGEQISGTITTDGIIKVTKRETSFNTCPICLTEGTLIETPDGLVPVEDIKKGMLVWSEDAAGERVAVPVLEIQNSGSRLSFKSVRLTLDDGRSIRVSAGHPTAEGQPVGVYTVGDLLDGGRIASLEYVDYEGLTYDLLPGGKTALYWANGILLKSTIPAK